MVQITVFELYKPYLAHNKCPPKTILRMLSRPPDDVNTTSPGRSMLDLARSLTNCLRESSGVDVMDLIPKLPDDPELAIN